MLSGRLQRTGRICSAVVARPSASVGGGVMGYLLAAAVRRVGTNSALDQNTCHESDKIVAV